MARLFGDGFDMYGAGGDLQLGRWSSANPTSLLAGVNTAFSVGQAARFGTNANAAVAIFETATNETTVFFSLRFRQTTFGSSTTGFFVQFRDGTNVQCTLYFRADGAILVYSGAVGGTILATLTSAYVVNTWDSYQGKVVFNNTTGTFELRKNGSVSPIINLSSVNTRAGSTNNYANQVNLSCNSSPPGSCDVDDVWFNSDNGAAPTTWPGDVRCITQMVASDSSAAFSKSPAPVSVTPYVTNNTTSKGTGLGLMAAFTASFSGTISSAILQVNTGGTGNLKCAIYDSTRATVLATSNAVVNPVAGSNAITFGTPLSVTKGTVYYLAADTDFTIIYTTLNNNGYSFSTAYASFPAVAPVTTGLTSSLVFTISIAPTLNNEFVSEPTEDADTTYVYSSTVSQEDKYGVAAMGVVPASIIGVAPFVFWKKSDSGARTGTISVTANGSGDTGEIVGVTPSLSYAYSQKFMPLDPTGVGWTAANVNAMLLGVTVVS
jgi:hypothetical protein